MLVVSQLRLQGRDFNFQCFDSVAEMPGFIALVRRFFFVFVQVVNEANDAAYYYNNNKSDYEK